MHRVPSSVNADSSFNRHTKKLVRRTLLVVAAALCITVLLLRLQTYRVVVAQAERLTLEALRHAAYTAALSVDGDAHERLRQRHMVKDAITSSEQDPDYASLHESLKQVSTLLELKSPVYTYVPCRAGKESMQEFIVTSAEQPYYRHSFSSEHAAHNTAFGVAGALGVYEDEYGSWLSAYAPVHNSSGEVVAMVQADEPFDAFIAAARQEASAGLVWNIVLILVVLAILALFFSDMLNRERRDKEALSAAVAEQTRLSATLTEHEEDLQRKARQLEERNRDLTDFANIASHDLKSPLRGIASFAQLLARRNRATLDPSSNEYLDFILSSSKRALNLVDRLLAYAKADQTSDVAQTFELSSAAKDALDNLHSLLEERGATVDLDALPEATGDQALLTQVFQNLIGNGIKYNRCSSPHIHVGCSLDDAGQHVFSVRDNGIGIPAEHQASVFEMFSRLHGGGEFEGSGIGLAFCVRVVDRYHGTMWLESVEGEGSTFYFTLPSAITATASQQAALT